MTTKELNELDGAELLNDFYARIDRLAMINHYYEDNGIEVPEWIVDKNIEMVEVFKKLGV